MRHDADLIAGLGELSADTAATAAVERPGRGRLPGAACTKVVWAAARSPGGSLSARKLKEPLTTSASRPSTIRCTASIRSVLWQRVAAT